MAQLTEQIIINAADREHINPYRQPFAPKDLHLNANNFGSFSDYCDNTVSSKWKKEVILKAVEFNNKNRPIKYLLL